MILGHLALKRYAIEFLLIFTREDESRRMARSNKYWMDVLFPEGFVVFIEVLLHPIAVVVEPLPRAWCIFVVTNCFRYIDDLDGIVLI